MAEKLLFDAKEALLIAGNRPATEAFLNNFYGTVSLAQLQRFEKLYRDLKTEIEIISLTAQQYIQQINAAYTRFQEHRSQDAFHPMDEKSMKYVLDFLQESIRDVAKEVQKNTAKSLTR